ncbi:MAG: hypothetical protein M3220_20230 [Chloroflexota bacterium]|nr:hypothetical protein [Chloroflexota bacterium]
MLKGATIRNWLTERLADLLFQAWTTVVRWRKRVGLERQPTKAWPRERIRQEIEALIEFTVTLEQQGELDKERAQLLIRDLSHLLMQYAYHVHPNTGQVEITISMEPATLPLSAVNLDDLSRIEPELADELRAWDALSDEALLSIEASLDDTVTHGTG